MRTDWFSDYMAWAAEHDNKSDSCISRCCRRESPRCRGRRGSASWWSTIRRRRRVSRGSEGSARCAGASRATCANGVRRGGGARGAGAARVRAATSTSSASSAPATRRARRAGGARARARGAPATVLVYVDHDELLSDGSRAHPDFKPSWDPYLFAQEPYFMRSAFARARRVGGGIRPASTRSRNGTCCGGSPRPRGRSAIAHLPRVLIHRAPAERAGSDVSAHPAAPAFRAPAAYRRRVRAADAARHGGCGCRFPPRRRA